MYIYIYICMYKCIYIYIEREREIWRYGRVPDCYKMRPRFHEALLGSRSPDSCRDA